VAVKAGQCGWVLTDFYPQMEEFDASVDRNRFEKSSLQSTVVSISGGIVRARLDGTLVMKRSFYPHQDDENRVKATLLGWIVFDTGRNHIDSFQLVTKTATYGANDPEAFNAALASLP